MTAPLDPDRAAPRRGSTAVSVVAVLWLLALFPLGGLLGLITLFGVSPTECYPPAPTFCTQEWLIPTTVAVVFLGWLAAVVLTATALNGRRGGNVALSVTVLAATAVAAAVAIGAWAT